MSARACRRLIRGRGGAARRLAAALTLLLPLAGGALAADPPPTPTTLELTPSPTAGARPLQMLERRPEDLLGRLRPSLPAAVEPALGAATQALGRRLEETWNWLVGGPEAPPMADEPFNVGGPMAPRSRLWPSARPLPVALTAQQANDPFESYNRLIYDFNSGLQRHALEPFADFYLRHTTHDVRTSVRNFFANLREPVTIAAAALVGDFEDAGNATARFGINTTLGVAGLFDPAADMGYEHRPRDLEQTLCQYGLPAGPYIVLPLLGPATTRDALARLTTLAVYVQAMGPALYAAYRVSNIAVNYVGIRETTTGIEADALDPYIVYRTLYLENRAVSCGATGSLEQYFTR